MTVEELIKELKGYPPDAECFFDSSGRSLSGTILQINPKEDAAVFIF